jgi:hypothetical protein
LAIRFAAHTKRKPNDFTLQKNVVLIRPSNLSAHEKNTNYRPFLHRLDHFGRGSGGLLAFAISDDFLFQQSSGIANRGPGAFSGSAFFGGDVDLANGWKVVPGKIIAICGILSVGGVIDRFAL